MTLTVIKENALYLAGLHLHDPRPIVGCNVTVNLTRHGNAYTPAYLRSPILDGPLPYPGLLEAITLWATTHIEHGYPVLVQCDEGVNRSGLVGALILRQLECISGTAAREAVQHAQRVKLNNPVFIKYLDSLGAP